MVSEFVRYSAMAIAAAGLMTGCAGIDSGPGPTVPQVSSLSATDIGYQLRPGDRVKIVVFSQDRFSGDFALSTGGQIVMAQIGPIKAAGLTVRGLEAVLKQRLERDAGVSNAHVSVLLDTPARS